VEYDKQAWKIKLHWAKWDKINNPKLLRFTSVDPNDRKSKHQLKQ